MTQTAPPPPQPRVRTDDVVASLPRPVAPRLMTRPLQRHTSLQATLFLLALSVGLALFVAGLRSGDVLVRQLSIASAVILFAVCTGGRSTREVQ